MRPDKGKEEKTEEKRGRGQHMIKGQDKRGEDKTRQTRPEKTRPEKTRGPDKTRPDQTRTWVFRGTAMVRGC